MASSGSSVKLIVLTLLYFPDDEKETIILPSQEMRELFTSLRNCLNVQAQEMRMEGKASFDTVRMPKGSAALREFGELTGLDGVSSVQVGYYHHRLLFELEFEGKEFSWIREFRGEVLQSIEREILQPFCRAVRDKNLSAMQPTGEVRRVCINACYTTSLIIVPYGMNHLEQERRQLKHLDLSASFETRGTGLGIELREMNFFMWTYRHWIRLSAMGMIVFLDGKRLLNARFLHRMYDALYYGGLHQKMKLDSQDRASQRSGGDPWPVDLMLSVYDILMGTIASVERELIQLRLQLTATWCAIIGIAITLVVVFVRSTSGAVCP